MQPTQETIYLPRRLGALLLLASLFTFIAALGVVILVRSGGNAAAIFGGALVLLFIAGPLALFVYANLEGLKRRVPLARLDHDGIECSQGRLNWGDVESIGVVEYRAGDGLHPYLYLSLPANTRLKATKATYYHSRWQSSPKVTEWSLLLPLWTSGKASISTMRRFYAGPVGEPITIHGDESTPPPAAAPS